MARAVVDFTIEGDFDRDGSYEENLNDRLTPRTGGLHVSRGLDRNGQYQITELGLTLRNNDGRFTPDNPSGPYAGKIEKGVGVRWRATHLAAPYNLWTGYVIRGDRIEVQRGQTGLAKFTVRDLLEYFAGFDTLKVLTSTTRLTDDALEAIAAALGLSPSLYNFDTGMQALALHFVPTGNALSALLDAVRSEMGGLLWVNGSGVLRFQSRAARLGGYGAPYATWGDGTTIKPLRAYEVLPDEELVTSVTVEATVFLDSQDEAEILRFSRGKDNRPADSLALAAGEIYETEIYYDAAVLALTAPVASRDYLANSSISGNGTDKTAQLSVTVTDLGGSARIRLQNNDGATIYVTEFRLKGTTSAYAADRPKFTAAKSIPGQVAEPGAAPIHLPFTDDTAQKAAHYAVALLRIHRYMPGRVIQTYQLERNDATAASLLGCDLGKLIRYKDTGIGANGLYKDDWFYVEAMTFDWSPGEFTDVEVTLVPSWAYRNLDKLLYDLFSRSDGSLGTALIGGAWANAGNVLIVSNKARPNNVAAQTPNLDLTAVDVVVEVSLSNMGSDTDEEVGVVYRLSDTSNYWRAYVDDGSNEVLLEKVVAGTPTTVASAAWTPTATAELQVICQGNRHRVRLDRKWVLDATDAALNTNTKAGLFSRSTTSVDFDDFYAQGL